MISLPVLYSIVLDLVVVHSDKVIDSQRVDHEGDEEDLNLINWLVTFVCYN